MPPAFLNGTSDHRQIHVCMHTVTLLCHRLIGFQWDIRTEINQDHSEYEYSIKTFGFPLPSVQLPNPFEISAISPTSFTFYINFHLKWSWSIWNLAIQYASNHHFHKSFKSLLSLCRSSVNAHFLLSISAIISPYSCTNSSNPIPIDLYAFNDCITRCSSFLVSSSLLWRLCLTEWKEWSHGKRIPKFMDQNPDRL